LVKSASYINNLLSRIAAGSDKKAFEEFYDLYYAKMVSIASVFAPDTEHAEEIVSESLLKLINHRKKLSSVRNINSYLFLCVKNQALTYIKKNKPYFSQVSIHKMEDHHFNTPMTPEEQVMGNELEDIITGLIAQMPPKRKVIFELIKNDGLSYKEVAKFLDISTKTVEVHMGLALQGMRQGIQHYKAEQSTKKQSLPIAN